MEYIFETLRLGYRTLAYLRSDIADVKMEHVSRQLHKSFGLSYAALRRAASGSPP